MRVRVIWALIMILFAYVLFSFANDIVFTIVVGIISLIAANELINTQKFVPLIIKIEIYLFLILTSIYSYYYGLLDAHYLIITFLILVISLVLYKHLEKFDFSNISIIFTMVIYLILGFNSLLNIKINFSLLIFFYPILVGVIADTFGYFGGKKFGKHKLIENVSPNKTWEGALFATIFASLFSYYYLHNFNLNNIQIIIITLIMVILSQVGDLVASSIKRTYDIKDYSKLIPGHGGILDRFDSILFNFIVLSVLLIYV
ncbi:MAG: phosphatidate cytidylyltransferase [Bacilli bacterium]